MSLTRAKDPVVWLAFFAGLAGWTLTVGAPSACFAQQPSVHYFHQGNLQPGTVGATRLQGGGPVVGYFQPVQIRAPSGVSISVAEGGTFGEPAPAPLTVGLLIGPVYRFRITDIPFFPGKEVYPTVEIIDRIYPPLGLEWQYPVVIELTLEDLRLALQGFFVTRVVYLEDPQRALPIATENTGQNWFEAPPGTDPLTIADQLGRPVAIVRLGGRVPATFPVPDEQFLYGCPPVMRSPAQAAETKAPPEGPQVPTKQASMPRRVF
ncbi:MAG: hypothetical protein NZ899_03455 [Thermoguttaceae bacterium]|nr:hypothetical protein [Thermoguttaceae bacterium]MDW8078827.1 hypothetical protein [Thermoguttaceae bacterium]